MRARSFFYASLGILALAIAFHLGARTATAQAPGNPVVTSFFNPTGPAAYAITANGDVFETTTGTSWHLTSNVFAGGPTPARQESMGAVKARYR